MDENTTNEQPMQDTGMSTPAPAPEVSKPEEAPTMEAMSGEGDMGSPPPMEDTSGGEGGGFLDKIKKMLGM